MNKKHPVARFVIGKAPRWLGACAVILISSAWFTPLAEEVASESETNQQERVIQTYGPVQALDTLWVIANRFHPNRSVTIYQTMAAIMDANPQAFPTDNVHDLHAGHFLEIPTGDRIRQIDAEEAYQRIVPQLGGTVQARTRAQQNAELAEREAQLVTLREALEQAQQDAERYAADNDAMQSRLRELERALEQVRAELEASVALEQETGEALRLARQEREQLAQQVSEAEVPDWRWFIQWPGVLVTVGLLILLLLALRGASRGRDRKEVHDSPHKVATAAHLSKQDEPQVAEIDSTETPEHDASERTRSESVAASETGEDAEPSEAEVLESQAPESTREAFREIDEILAEAEADADPDSDVDEGQTEDEAAAFSRDQQAAQLDLARAYIEMGELAEARAAIDEVFDQTDAELREEALALLKKIEDKE